MKQHLATAVLYSYSLSQDVRQKMELNEDEEQY